MTDNRRRWSNEERDYVMRETRLGVSAAVLGEVLGLSRNAVLGKLARLRDEGFDLPYRPPAAKREGRQGSAWSKGVRRPPPHEETEAVRALKGWAESEKRGGLISLDELTEHPPGPRLFTARRFGECAWPVSGASTETFSCCSPVTAPGRPYCAEHTALAYVPQTRKRSTTPLRTGAPTRRVFGL